MRTLLTPVLFVVASLFVVPVVCAQQTESRETQDAQTEMAQAKAVKSGEPSAKPLQPKWNGYKGVTIGMSAKEVRKQLDGLKEKGELQDFFVFSETENGQVFYDAEGKVKAIAVNFLDSRKAPEVEAVLGVEAEAKADGSMYKLVRYPEDDYWVAYSRTPGEAPLTTITIQKMR